MGENWGVYTPSEMSFLSVGEVAEDLCGGCSFIGVSPFGSFSWRKEGRRGAFQAESSLRAKILRQKQA